MMKYQKYKCAVEGRLTDLGNNVGMLAVEMTFKQLSLTKGMYIVHAAYTKRFVCAVVQILKITSSHHFSMYIPYGMCYECVAGHQRLPELAKGLRQSRGKQRVAMDAVSARLGVNVAVDKPLLLQHTAKKQTTPAYCAFPRRTTPLPGNQH